MITRRYKTLQGAASQTHQLTFQEVLNGQFNHKTLGWINFKIDNLDKIVEDVAYRVIEGRKQDLVYNRLYYGAGVKHWALERIIYCTKRKKFSYNAGQDYVWELNELRKYLYNL